MEKRQHLNYRQDGNLPGTSKSVLQKADFELFSGEFVYLIGRVGSGKVRC